MQYVTPLLTNRINEVVWGNENGKINNGDIAPENVSSVRCPKVYDFSIDLKI